MESQSRFLGPLADSDHSPRAPRGQMKIALVHDFLTGWGGGERVLRALSELWPAAPIYVLATDQAIIDEFLPGTTIIPSYLQHFPGMPRTFKYYLSLMPKAIESFDLSGYDLVFSY